MDIFDRLKAKGILEARVGFEGRHGSCALPYVRCYPDSKEAVPCDPALQESLENLAWEVLLESQASFREEGAFGQVIVNVEAGEVEVVVNQRHVSTFVESFRLQDGRRLSEVSPGGGRSRPLSW